MGEWQAWHPTVSRQSRSTDITDGFGPGTRWSAGPESYSDEVVAASPGLRVPSGPPPARRPGSRCLLVLVSLSWCLRAAARPRDRHTRACGSEWSISKPGQALPPPSGTRECTLARRHPSHWWRGRVVGGQALPPPSDTEVVAASLVFRVPSGPPARSPPAPRAYGSARRLEARPGPAVPPAPSTLPCGPTGTLHTALRSHRYPPHWWRGRVVGGQARTWRTHGLGAELPCTRRRVQKCDGLNVSEPTEHSTIARGTHAVK